MTRFPMLKWYTPLCQQCFTTGNFGKGLKWTKSYLTQFDQKDLAKLWGIRGMVCPILLTEEYPKLWFLQINHLLKISHKSVPSLIPWHRSVFHFTLPGLRQQDNHLRHMLTINAHSHSVTVPTFTGTFSSIYICIYKSTFWKCV